MSTTVKADLMSRLFMDPEGVRKFVMPLLHMVYEQYDLPPVIRPHLEHGAKSNDVKRMMSVVLFGFAFEEEAFETFQFSTEFGTDEEAKQRKDKMIAFRPKVNDLAMKLLNSAYTEDNVEKLVDLFVDETSQAWIMM